MVLNNNEVVIDEHSYNKIRLTMKHRRILDLEMPTFITDYYLDDLHHDIKEYYINENHDVSYKNYHVDCMKIKRLLTESDVSTISLYSLNNERQIKKKKTASVSQKVDFVFIGTAYWTKRP